jgi:hypothetical protein
LQDAIKSQVATATTVAATPYQAYTGPNVAGFTEAQKDAQRLVAQNVGQWQAGLSKAIGGLDSLSGKGTADQLSAQQNTYLNPQLSQQQLRAGRDFINRAGALDVVGAANPYMSQAGSTVGRALSGNSIDAASPYLQAASQTSAQGVGQYMNPYTDYVTDQIAKLGTRNLTENLLPGMSDAFIKAGQFGGSRMGEFGSRALRDTQESILGQQSTALQQGYGQALTASQSDLARQGQLATLMGNLSGSDLSRTLQGATQYGNLANSASDQESKQMQNLTSLGQVSSTAGQAQQQAGLQSAQQVATAQAGDYTRQQSVINQMAQMEKDAQSLRVQDANSLMTMGNQQQGLQQARNDASRADWDAQQSYDKGQADWLAQQLQLAGRGAATTATGSVNNQGVSSGLTQLASTNVANTTAAGTTTGPNTGTAAGTTTGTNTGTAAGTTTGTNTGLTAGFQNTGTTGTQNQLTNTSSLTTPSNTTSTTSGTGQTYAPSTAANIGAGVTSGLAVAALLKQIREST